MSLQVWLPFTQDNENKGLDNIYFSGGSLVDGRYGKCSTGTVQAASSTLTSDEGFSFSLWWKITGDESHSITLPINTGVDENVVLTFARIGYDGYQAIKLSTTGNKPQMIWVYDDRLESGVWTKGKWHHFTVTVQNVNNKMTVRVYVDKVLTNTYTSTTYKLTLCPGNIIIAGTAPRNDFRLYDHCLSQTEIERDYATLLLHYPLRDPEIENTTNLLAYPKPTGLANHSWDASLHPNALPVTGWNTGYNGGVSNPTTTIHGYWNLIDNIPTMVLNDIGQSWIGVVSNSDKTILPAIGLEGKYVISFEAKASVNKKQINTGLHYTNTAGTTNFHDGTKTFTLTTEWQKYYVVKTLKSDADLTQGARVYMYGHTGDIQGIAYVRNMQIETNDHPTEYVKEQRQNVTIYDCSGRGHDSVARGDLIIQSDGARNVNCVQFTSNNAIKFPNPFHTTAINECSVAFWIQLDETNNYMNIFSSNYGAPTSSAAGWLSLNCEGYPMWFYSNNNYWRSSKNEPFEVGKWYHIVFTFKNGTVQFFCNGELYSSKVTISTATSFNGASYFSLGDSYTGTSWSGAPFNGKISDFRIYGVALDESIVYDLYANSATIDKSGNIHAFEFVEG